MMDAYSIEKTLGAAKETVHRLDYTKDDDKGELLWTVYKMLATLLEDAADNAAARALAESQRK